MDNEQLWARARAPLTLTLGITLVGGLIYGFREHCRGLEQEAVIGESSDAVTPTDRLFDDDTSVGPAEPHIPLFVDAGVDDAGVDDAGTTGSLRQDFEAKCSRILAQNPDTDEFSDALLN